jgi:hypothetical protein
MSDCCKEIAELRDIVKEMNADEKGARALKLIEGLNDRMAVMEEYYLSRIELYQRRSAEEVKAAEERSMESDSRYLSSLVKMKQLRKKMEELQLKNNLYKSRVLDGGE